MSQIWQEEIVKRLDVEILKCRENIERTERLPTMHGDKWKSGMLAHWNKRLEGLLEQKSKRQA